MNILLLLLLIVGREILRRGGAKKKAERKTPTIHVWLNRSKALLTKLTSLHMFGRCLLSFDYVFLGARSWSSRVLERRLKEI